VYISSNFTSRLMCSNTRSKSNLEKIDNWTQGRL